MNNTIKCKYRGREIEIIEDVVFGVEDSRMSGSVTEGFLLMPDFIFKD